MVMTSNSTETVAEAAPLTINEIVGGLRARHVVSELDRKVTAALEQALNNHATGSRKLVLAVLGPSGVGKTKAIKRLLSEDRFDGKVVSVVATSPASVQTLARDALHEMGHPLTRRQMDEQVSISLLKNGLGKTSTIVFHVDEAQHLFTSNGEITITRTLDAFKLLVQAPYEVVLVLTGTDRVQEVFARDDQLHERTIYVEAKRLSVNDDSFQTGKILNAYCQKAGLKQGWVDADRLPQRITHAGRTFGLAVSLIIDAIELELRSGGSTLSPESFAKVYARDRDVGAYLNPFVVEDFLAIDPSRRTEAASDNSGYPARKSRGPKKKAAMR
jgi:hypothetical protein